MLNSQFLCNVIIQVTIIFIFLCVFFFTYVKNEEAHVVTNNVDFIIEEFLGQGKINFIDNETRSILRNNLKEESPTQDSIDADNNVEKANKQVIQKTIKSVTIVVIIVLLFVMFCFFMNKYKVFPSFFSKLKFKEIAIESSVILLVVALTELCFVKFFASNFISIEPNLIKAAFLKNIKNYSEL